MNTLGNGQRGRERLVEGTVYRIIEVVDPRGWALTRGDGALAFVQRRHGQWVGSWSDGSPFDPKLVERIILGVV